MNKTIESIQAEINELHTCLVLNAQELCINRREHDRTSELLLARTEIYKSICHRQVMMLSIISNNINYLKVA